MTGYPHTPPLKGEPRTESAARATDENFVGLGELTNFRDSEDCHQTRLDAVSSSNDSTTTVAQPKPSCPGFVVSQVSNLPCRGLQLQPRRQQISEALRGVAIDAQCAMCGRPTRARPPPSKRVSALDIELRWDDAVQRDRQDLVQNLQRR